MGRHAKRNDYGDLILIGACSLLAGIAVALAATSGTSKPEETSWKPPTHSAVATRSSAPTALAPVTVVPATQPLLTVAPDPSSASRRGSIVRVATTHDAASPKSSASGAATPDLDFGTGGAAAYPPPTSTPCPGGAPGVWVTCTTNINP